MEVLVVGGAGAMGGWFVEFFDGLGWDVDVSDPGAEDSVPLSRADDYDVVVVAVPIESAPDVIRDVAPRISDGLLMDVTSVKRAPVEAMRNAPDGVELLGTHPMFGPSVRSMRGQTVILVRERVGETARRVEDAFREAGANVQYATAEEHDEMMSVVQGLTHFAYISIGRSLERLDFDVDESRRFMSPVYEIMIDFVGRVLHQNPHLYADIQTNQPVEEVHEALVESAHEVSDAVEEGDKDAFVEAMHEAARHYGDTRSAQRRSDKLIEANVAEYEELHDSVGEERALRHIYSRNVHLGTVRRVEGQTVVLSPRRGNGDLELKVENVELLGRDEERDWKVDNLPRRERDVSVVLGDGVDTDVLEDVGMRSHDDVLDAETVDVYDGDAVDDVSYTVRFEILDDGNVDEAVDEVKRVYEGVGGVLRS